MGDSFRDPVDHVRTTRPFAGESMIDIVNWPGYLLIAASVIADAACLAAFASGLDTQGLVLVVVSIATTVLGLTWLAVEHRRVRRIADRWYAQHPDAQRQRPAS